MGRRNQLAIPRNVSVWEPLNLPGCVAYWPFDEPRPIDAARDIVGGYNLTQVGNPAVATDRTDTRGARQGFAAGNGNGAGFIRSVAASGTPVIAQGASFSFCFWLYFQTSLNASGTSSTAFMLNLTNTTDANGQIRFSAGSPGTGWTNLSSRLYHTDSTFTTVWIGINNAPTNALTALPNNQWSHWVWLYDAAAHQVCVYRDGTLINTVAATAGKTSSGIGGGLGTGGGNWQIPGLVDDVALFNRVLTADEITLLATTNRPIAGLANPVASPLDIPNCAIWLDGADTSTMYTSDAGVVTPVTSPTDITGCVGWWDASDTSTLFQDTAGTIAATAGTNVARWDDKSGLGRNATQATASACPVRQAIGTNSALYFDGGDSLTATRPADATHTILAVIWPLQTIPNGGSPFGISTLSAFHPIASTGDMSWHARSDGLYIISSVTFGTQPAIVGYTNNNATVTGYKDGAIVFSGLASTEVSTANGLTLGRRPTAPGIVGYICEAVVFDSVLSAADRARVERYLALKWGVPGVHARSEVSGQPIGYWANKAGNDFNFFAATLAARAALSPSRLNNIPPVEFNGTSSTLECSSFNFSGNEISAFCVYQADNLSTGPVVWDYAYTSSATNQQGITGFSNAAGVQLSPSAATSRIETMRSFTAYQGGVGNSIPGARRATISSLVGTFSTAPTRAALLNSVVGTFNTASRYNGNIWPLFTLGTRRSSGTADAASLFLGGRIAEFIVYSRAVTDAERARIERYLDNKWGVGLILPVAAHPDAQDWVNRVYLNGGTCSQNTVDAVSSFCREIDAADLRAKFYRLNLFCGNELIACRTPLYRGPNANERHGFDLDVLTVGSGGSSVFTNTDYVEYGINGGLAGRLQTTTNANAGPGLRTGLVPYFIPAFYGPPRPTGGSSFNYSSIHLAVYCRSLRTQTLGTGYLIGAYGGVGPAFEARHGMSFYVNQNAWGVGPFVAQSSGQYDNFNRGLYLANVRPTGDIVASEYVNELTLYTGGLRYNSSTIELGPFLHPNTDFGVFGECRASVAYSQNDNSLFRAEQTLQGYSIGLGMTETQAQAYNAIMNRFQNRLGRGLPEPAPAPFFAGITHADTLNWISRVYAYGGTVSATTATAVQTFCNAIDAAGIRNKFYRLNLFCGSTFYAAVVPLYRGPSLSGTQYGNTVDTWENFTPADYTETGAAVGGFKGDGVSKCLYTGVYDADLGADVHLSAYVNQHTALLNKQDIGNVNSDANTNRLSLYSAGTGAYWFNNSSSQQAAQINTADRLPGFYVGSGSATNATIYKGLLNGLIGQASNTMTQRATTRQTIRVFAGQNSAGSITSASDSRMSGYSIGLSLTTQQVTAFNTAMQTFQAALSRNANASTDPIFASITNPDAQLWIDNVYANNGTVSLATATAVNAFCNAIDAAGIRDRFYRLNLFCGNNFAAALVPLYRGQSAAGTKFGNATDTSINFLTTDYVETGANGGLNSQSSFSRYLDIGTITSMDAASQHLSSYGRLRSGQTNLGGFGMNIAGTGWESRIHYRGALTGRVWIGAQFWGGDFTPTSTVTQTTFVLGSRTSASNMFVQFNGVTNGSDTVTRTVPAASAASVTVCSQFTGSYFDGIMAAYSFGLGMTATQAQAFNTAMQTFQTALGRNV